MAEAQRDIYVAHLAQASLSWLRAEERVIVLDDDLNARMTTVYRVDAQDAQRRIDEPVGGDVFLPIPVDLRATVSEAFSIGVVASSYGGEADLVPGRVLGTLPAGEYAVRVDRGVLRSDFHLRVVTLDDGVALDKWRGDGDRDGHRSHRSPAGRLRRWWSPCGTARIPIHDGRGCGRLTVATELKLTVSRVALLVHVDLDRLVGDLAALAARVDDTVPISLRETWWNSVAEPRVDSLRRALEELGKSLVVRRRNDLNSEAKSAVEAIVADLEHAKVQLRVGLPVGAPDALGRLASTRRDLCVLFDLGPGGTVPFATNENSLRLDGIAFAYSPRASSGPDGWTIPVALGAVAIVLLGLAMRVFGTDPFGGALTEQELGRDVDAITSILVLVPGLIYVHIDHLMFGDVATARARGAKVRVLSAVLLLPVLLAVLAVGGAAPETFGRALTTLSGVVAAVAVYAGRALSAPSMARRRGLITEDEARLWQKQREGAKDRDPVAAATPTRPAEQGSDDG